VYSIDHKRGTADGPVMQIQIQVVGLDTRACPLNTDRKRVHT
jgi:hypothetical protein